MTKWNWHERVRHEALFLPAQSAILIIDLAREKVIFNLFYSATIPIEVIDTTTTKPQMWRFLSHVEVSGTLSPGLVINGAAVTIHHNEIVLAIFVFWQTVKLRNGFAHTKHLSIHVAITSLW
jgi:hypothetical protein